MLFLATTMFESPPQLLRKGVFDSAAGGRSAWPARTALRVMPLSVARYHTPCFIVCRCVANERSGPGRQALAQGGFHHVSRGPHSGPAPEGRRALIDQHLQAAQGLTAAHA